MDKISHSKKPATTDNSEKVKSLFADYPKAKAFYFTADGFAYFTPEEAQAHAATLKDNTVQTIKRDDNVTKS